VDLKFPQRGENSFEVEAKAAPSDPNHWNRFALQESFDESTADAEESSNN